MKQLWAPWRMEFLTDPKKAVTGDCVFCGLVSEKDDKANLIVHRGKHAFVILNKYPYNNGHLMVIPFRHTNDFTSLGADELAEMSALTQHAMKAIAGAYQPQGFNLGMNLGAAAGAGIKEHLHMHVVPRWTGDTNFLPVLGDTKSMPQHLSASLEALTPYFRKELGQS